MQFIHSLFIKIALIANIKNIINFQQNLLDDWNTKIETDYNNHLRQGLGCTYIRIGSHRGKSCPFEETLDTLVDAEPESITFTCIVQGSTKKRVSFYKTTYYLTCYKTKRNGIVYYNTILDTHDTANRIYFTIAFEILNIIVLMSYCAVNLLCHLSTVPLIYCTINLLYH